MSKKIFWFDTETTGLNSWHQDIIQLAFIVEINGEVKEQGQIRMQPLDYSKVEQKALDVHGITLAKMKEFPTQAEGFSALMRVIGRHVDKYNYEDRFTPAGHNCSFDMGFLQALFKKNSCSEFSKYFDYHYLDTMVLANFLNFYGLIKTKNVKLVTMAEHFGIPLDAHDAMNDIVATRTLAMKMNNYFTVGG